MAREAHPIADAEFAVVVQHAPLVSIDLIITDSNQKVLLALRNNEPAKDTYFVPGGLIRKNEKISDAFARIMRAELGISREFREAVFLGVFEHFYTTNRFGDPRYGTHYVVLAYRIGFPPRSAVTLDSQHRSFRWMDGAEIVAAADVHPNTKAYFE